MPELYEARRQDMQTKPAKELHLRERHGADLSAMGIILIPESNRAVLKIQSLKAAVGDSNPVGVAGEVRQNRLRACKGPLGVNDPFGDADASQPTGEQSRVCQAQLGAGELQLPLLEKLL